MSLRTQQLRDITALWLAGAMAGKWSQVSLAEASGVARETIWRILKRRTDAKDGTLVSLAEALRVPLPNLLGRSPDGLYRAQDVQGQPLDRLLAMVRARHPDDVFMGAVVDELEGRLRHLGVLAIGPVAPPDAASGGR